MDKSYKQSIIKYLQNLSQKLTFSAKLQFFIFGIASTAWFLIRVIPKPSRASYPCMKAAAPFASAFVLYLVSLTSSVFFFKRFGNYLKLGKAQLALLFLALGIGASIIALTHSNSQASAAETPLEGANLPKGIAKGINPGRVVWVYDTAATNKNCTNAYGDGYFMDTNTDQNEVDKMLDAALKDLTGQSTLAGAWDAVFKYHNQTRGKGSVGYSSSEPIFLKINATSTWYENINSSYGRNNNGYYSIGETSPQVVLAVLRQLVYKAGVPESKIYVGDPLKQIYQDNYTKWHNEFPNVHYLDHYSSSNGREKVVKSSTAIVRYSDRGSILKTTSGTAVYTDSLYTIFESMEYMINIPNLKAHEYGGVSMFGKNHFGSQTRSDASHLHSGLVSNGTTLRNTYGQYRVQVDLMAHQLLGKKNLFYLMDALYCGYKSTSKPTKWQIAPFNSDWTSSLFLSQDPVAIESVGFDFLYAQYTGADGNNSYPHMGAVDDYLHQLADSTTWPAGIVYDPENDGKSIGYSQGVHEHWNNATDKKYSRNLGTGLGIELLQHFIYTQTDTIPVTGVSLNSTSLSLPVGSTSTLTATVLPSTATNKAVNWSSSNTSIAKVSSSGVVTAVAAGSVTITITTANSGKTATCAVTVENTVATATTIYVDFGPNDGTNGNITSSPDTNGNYWNNITNTSTSASTVNLVDNKNLSTGAFIKITSDFSSNGIQNGGLLSPSASLLGDFAINTATQDYFFTQTSSSFTTGGLDKTKGYVFYLFGTRNDPETRITTYTLQGSNTYSGTLQTSGTDLGGTGYNGNTKTILTSDAVTPDSNGQISVTVTRTTGTFGYLGVMKIKKIIPVTGVSLSSTSLSLTVGSTSTLTATVSPSNATNQSVSWSSSNTSIAKVSSSGVVTAVAVGNATITVTTADGSKTATCALTVTVPVTGVTLNTTNLSLTPGGTSTLTATVSPSNATNQSVSWSSSNTSIATVSSSSVVTAVSAGTATITVTTADGSKTATCTVTVSVTTTVPVTGVALSPTSLSLTVGGTSTLTASVSPSNATNQSVSWLSSNTSAATVNTSGVVTAIAAGSVTITVTTADSSKTATCAVTVADAVATATTIYVDFGPNDVTNGNITSSPDTNGNYWNNITNTSASSAAVNLIDNKNSPTGAFITITSGFSSNGIQNGGLLTPDASLLSDFAINTATQDYFYTQTSSSFTVGGLDKSKGYVFYMFGTRNDPETRTTTYTLQGSNTYSGTLQTSGTNLGGTSYHGNTKTILTSDTVMPDGNGQISIMVTKASGTFGYLGVMKIKKVKAASVIPVTGIALNTASLSLTNVSTSKLTATVAPANATNQSVTWSSDNTSVATVSSSGVVTAVAAGSATITVTTADGSKTATCAVTVIVPVTGVSISPTSLTLIAGSTSALITSISPSNATNLTVSWSSGNTSVATVSSSGVVTAVAPGSTTLTVTTADGNKTATCAVKVLANLALNKGVTSSSDESTDLVPKYATDGNYGTRWSSAFSDPQWVYVDLGATYNIKNVKLYWEAAYAKSYSIKVWVNSAWVDVYSTTVGDGATDDLIVTPSQSRYVMVYGTARGTEYGYSLYEFEVYGDTIDAQAPTAPTGLNSPSQTQTSISLAWIASTDNVGVTGYDVYKDGTYATSVTATSCTIAGLTANTAYTFTVKAKDAADNYSAASNALTVSSSAIPVTGVALSSSNLSLTAGNTAMLMATVSPADASNKTLNWTSDNTSVTTVSTSGEITAISAGTATITATTASGSKTATCAITVADPVPVAGVTLSSPDLNLTVGGKSSLTATISPSNATNQTVSWASSNTSVATVSSIGFVTAVGAGTATITVTTADGSKTAACPVTVIVPVTGVTLNSSGLSLATGSTSTLTATIAPSNATNQSVTWASDNMSVATVNSSGVVTAVAIGTATITVTTADGSKTATCAVTVSIPVDGVTLSSASLPLIPAETSILTATVSPANATNQSVTWASSNTNVATVSTSGVVTAVAAGTAIITTTTVDGSKTATCVVTVTVPVTGVTLSSSSLTLNLSSTSELIATVFPANATNQSVTWSSDNTSVATVSSSGIVTAIATGTATITAITNDGTKTATCAVTVNSSIPVTSIALNTSFLAIATCQSSSLTATILPSNATNTAITWSSDNTNIATVSSSGVVKAIAIGTANITATAQDGAKTTTCKVSITSQTITGIAVGVSETITCKSSSVTLSSLSGTYKNYKWSGPNSFSSTAKSPSVSTPGIYTLTVIDTVNNCTVTAITNVLQNTVKPVARASSNGTLSCGTKTVSLKVATTTPNTVITWDGQTTGVNPVSMQWPGKYFVTTKDTVNGCTKRDSVTVAQNITYNSTQFYNNTFSAYANGTIADNATNGWTLDRSKIPGATTTYGSNTTSHYFAVYSKRLTAQQLGGEGIFYSNVMNVSGKPNFQIGVNIATEGTMTSSDYVKLFYKLDGGAEIAWDSRTGAFSQDFRSPLLNANTVQIVVKIYSTIKGSTYTSNHYILQYQLYIQDCGYPLVVYSSATGEINCANPSITLQANSSHAGATYKWTGPNSFTSTAQYPVVSAPGTYTVIASMPTTANSSVTSSTVTGTVGVTQNITIPYATVGMPDTISSQKKYVSLSGSSATSGVTYKWTGPNSFISNSQNPFVTAPGSYSLAVGNPVNGCASTATVNVAQNSSKAALLSPIAEKTVENNLVQKQPVFDIYPNPADNMLWFKTNGTGSIVSIRVFNMMGKEVKVSINREESSMGVSNLTSGIYIIIIETEMGKFGKKFIKN